MSNVPRRAFIKAATIFAVSGYSIGKAGIGIALDKAKSAEIQGMQTASNAVAVPPVVVGNNFRKAVEIAGEILQNGGEALDAIEKGINAIESDPSITSVGIGGMPNWEGIVELDASIMYGPTQNCGAVAALQGVENPISVARKVMEKTPHVLLVGQGAQDFALKMGFVKKELLTEKAKERWQSRAKYASLQERITKLIEDDPKRAAESLRKFIGDSGIRKAAVLVFRVLNREGSAKVVEQLSLQEREELQKTFLGIGIEKGRMPFEERMGLLEEFERILTDKALKPHDTVGLIVMDKNGNLYCGTSTSGSALKLPGRVGDSPLIGAGSYVDNDVGGAVATGTGEHVIRFAGASVIVENMRHGMSPEEACRNVINRMLTNIQRPDVMFTALNKNGQYASVGTGNPNFESFVFTKGKTVAIEGVNIRP